MRGKFVLVLGAAVAAAVAISQWDTEPTSDLEDPNAGASETALL